MKKYKIGKLLATRIAAPMALCSACLGATPVPTGGFFPDLVLQNHATAAYTHLSDFSGKILVLECYAWWCSPACTDGTPAMHNNVTIYYKNRNGVNGKGVPVQVVAVNFDRGSAGYFSGPLDLSQQRNNQFIAANGLEPVLDDPNGAVYDRIDELNNARVVVVNLTTNSPAFSYGEVVGHGVAWAPAAIRDLIEKVSTSTAGVAPKITIEARDRIVAEGGRLVLETKVSGLPRPDLQWLRNGTPMPGQIDEILDIPSIRYAGVEEYQIRARNAAGETFGKAVSVTVQPERVAKGLLDTGLARMTQRSDGGSTSTRMIEVDSLGRVTLVGHLRKSYGTRPWQQNVRLFADGAFDTNYHGNINGGGSIIGQIAWATGGNLAFGDFYGFGFDDHRGLARLKNNGDVVEDFNPTLSNEDNAAPIVSDAVMMSDGGILITGGFNQINGKSVSGFAKLRSDGTLDSSFPYAGGPSLDGHVGFVNSLHLTAKGQILMGGNFDSYDGESSTLLVRLNSDGTRDMDFRVSLRGYSVSRIQIDPVGRILVAGAITWESAGKYYHNLERLLPDGSIDFTFLPAPEVSSPSDEPIRALEIEPDGGILLSRGASLFRLMPSGALDRSFNVPLDLTYLGSAKNATILCLRRQADGELWIGGVFDTANGYPVPGAVRIHGPAAGTAKLSYFGIEPGGWLRAQSVVHPGQRYRLQWSQTVENWTNAGFYTATNHTQIFRLEPNSELSRFMRILSD